MLQKILDNFDIDTYGWFDLSAPNTANNYSVLDRTQEITDDIWSLWAQTPTTVEYRDYNSFTKSTIFHAIKWFHSEATNHRPFLPEERNRLVNNFLTSYRNGYSYGNLLDPDDAYKTEDRKIFIPTSLVSDRLLEKSQDIFNLADAITGYGLESMERDVACLDIGYDGLMTVHAAIAASESRNPDPTTQLLPPTTVKADCALDIWYASCIRDIRSRILSHWPGWHSIFEAQDSVLLPPTQDMQTTVSRKSKHRSELRRFCMALAWNLNATPNNRIPFPKSFKPAYDLAVSRWPDIASASRKDQSHFTLIAKLVNDLTNLLSPDEVPPTKQSAPNSGSNQLALNGSPSTHRSIIKSSAGPRSGTSSPIEPAKNTEDKEPGNSDVMGVPPPPLFRSVLPESSIDVLLRKHETLRTYRDKSMRLQNAVRKNIADSISAASWYVQLPPPSDYGQIQGVLDEGSLLNLAAFNDPHIFSTPPEVGHGQIAIAILVDSSSSMNSSQLEECGTPDKPDYEYGPSCMQQALAFCAGLKDGLSRSPNVSLCLLAYSTPSSSMHHTGFVDIHTSDINPTNDQRVCSLRRLDTEQALQLTMPNGGTPSGTAIVSASDYLHAKYPDAAKLIVHLTDGAPCGDVFSPYTNDDDDNHFQESTKNLARIINDLPIPVFGIGFGVDARASEMREQYNHDKWFVVPTPLDAVSVACQLITGIGQCLANR